MADTNKYRGEIALPEAGKGAFIRIDVDALERLESTYGEDYLDIVMSGMNKARIPVFKEMIAVGLKIDGEPKDFPYGLSIEEIQRRLLDSLFVAIYGQTFEERRAEDEKKQDAELQKRLDQVKENPHLAGLLSSMSQGEMGIDPA